MGPGYAIMAGMLTRTTVFRPVVNRIFKQETDGYHPNLWVRQLALMFLRMLTTSICIQINACMCPSACLSCTCMYVCMYDRVCKFVSKA